MSDKLYIVVRADLPAGLQLPQSYHAGRLFAAEHPALEQYWYEHSNNLVIVSVPNKEALAKLAYEMTVRGLAVSMFREPDLGGEPTALAVEPAGGKMLSRHPLALRAQDLGATRAAA